MKSWYLPLGLVLIWGYSMLVGTPPSQAFPPAGSPCAQNPIPAGAKPECDWWIQQTNIQTGTACCGAPGQDGHVLSEWDGQTPPKEDDWRIDSQIAEAHDAKWPGGCDPSQDISSSPCGTAPSGYQIFIGGAWVDVPWHAQTTVRGIEPDAAMRYKAKAWWGSYTELDGKVSYWFYCFQGGAGY